MAKKKVNKSQLIRDYLSKHPDKSPKEIAEQIYKDHKVEVTPKFVSTTKSEVKREGAMPVASRSSSAAKVATAPKKGDKLSQHVENLKVAAQVLGKEEAKRIIELL